MNHLTIGKNYPNEVNVVIEIPAESSPVKYEVNKETGLVHVDRFIATAMFYPANYGYIPQTLGGDGDPLDALVVTPYTLAVGCVIPARPVGMLFTEDETGIDSKIIMVPTKKLTKLYDHVEEVQDLGQIFIKKLQHFFENYKGLDEGKWVKVKGLGSRADAIKEIEKSFSEAKK